MKTILENNMVIEERVQSSWEELLSRGMEARELKDNSQWTLGDLATQIEIEYGENTIGKYGYAIGVEKKTLMNYRTVAKKFSPPLRTKYAKLSFSHFATLSAVEKPEVWLEKADNEEWSVEHLRKEVVEAHPRDIGIKLEDTPPEVFRCPECNLWRLKDQSAFDVCRGHYQLGERGLEYK